MALTGQLNDLSLAELIEFFCNQRKIGRLNVAYKRGMGIFYLEEGELVDAKIGNLNGVEAVYFALTLPNASFDFVANERAPQRTIKESWAQVILEGLRRFDEKQFAREDEIFAGAPPVVESISKSNLSAKKNVANEKAEDERSFESNEMFASVSQMQSPSNGKSRAVFVGGIAVAIVGITTIGAFVGLGGKGKSANPVETKAPVVVSQPDTSSANSSKADDNSASSPVSVETSPTSAPNLNESAEVVAARRERQRQLAEQQRIEQQRTEQQRAMSKPANTNTPAPTEQPAQPKGGQTVVVRVSVDADGHVSQASVANSRPGMEAYEAAALRAARSKRFPAGQAGMQSVPIKIN